MLRTVDVTGSSYGRGVDEPQFEVVGADTRYWGEAGGSYSPDGAFRWSYGRLIGNGGTICWIGLNPGTGDREGRYRPTLQRMVDRSLAEGMGRIILVNLFAWRATDPKDLRRRDAERHDIIGTECDAAIRDAIERSEVVVAAWGSHGRLLGRGRAVAAMADELRCLGTTSKGDPRHPLYVPLSQPLVGFTARL